MEGLSPIEEVSSALRTEEIHMRSSRRSFLGLLVLGAIAPAALAGKEGIPLEVWKGPSCECCNDWIRHVEANGFSVKSHDTGNQEIRARLGLPVRYGSCHTALVAGYAIEGHVPAREIQRLLRERPDALGLTVPAMPVGTPGMDGPEYRGRKDPYDVLLVRKDGSATVFQAYR
jgi:hypothetical protein